MVDAVQPDIPATPPAVEQPISTEVDPNAAPVSSGAEDGSSAPLSGQGDSAPTDAAQPESAENPTDGSEPDPEDSGHVSLAREMVVNAARRQLGVAVVMGGGNSSGPTAPPGSTSEDDEVGFDSAGLVAYALAAGGITASHLSGEQVDLGPRIPVDICEPGDIVAFGSNGTDTAIYSDEDKVIEAPDSGGVVIERELDDNEDAWGVSLEDLYQRQ